MRKNGWMARTWPALSITAKYRCSNLPMRYRPEFRSTDNLFAGRRKWISRMRIQTIQRARQRKSRTIHSPRKKRSERQRASLHSSEPPMELITRTVPIISRLSVLDRSRASTQKVAIPLWAGSFIVALYAMSPSGPSRPIRPVVSRSAQKGSPEKAEAGQSAANDPTRT